MRKLERIVRIQQRRWFILPAAIRFALGFFFLLMSPSPETFESDPAWLARLHAGDGSLFEELQHAHGANLIAFLASRGTEANLCDDIAQEVWIKAFVRRHQFQGGSFRAWLFQAAKNQRIDEARRRRPVEMPPTFDAPDLAGVQSDRETDQRSALDDCWESLPPELNTTLRSYYFDEVTYDQIADQLKIPAGTVATRIHRAKQSLKACIEGKLA